MDELRWVARMVWRARTMATTPEQRNRFLQAAREIAAFADKRQREQEGT